MAEISGSVGRSTNKAKPGENSLPLDGPVIGSQAVEIAMALVIALVGIWVCWDVRSQPYYDAYGPGPAFFPRWIGGLLIAVAAMIMVNALRQGWPRSEESFFPDRSSFLDIGSILASALLFALLIDKLGFVLTTFPILVLFLLMRGCRHLPTLLLISLGGSVGVGYAFGNWLGVFIPPAPHLLLRFMGL